ncbi:MAG: 4-hydroxy-tetrahydrodipicolinate synthase [Proteobacteria bacterium]|nr:4-hydroxy-tetrahydrodipicolinate synthase [Burkholderiales bacterium]
MFSGSMVAIVTPMHVDGGLDLDRLRALIDWQIAEGTEGIVIVGTTGESPTVDYEEHCLLIRTAVEQVAKRVPVIAGTGANSTSEAVELTRYAKEIGAAAGLSVVPYYNRPTQEGLYRHFRTISEAVDLPVVLYNVPSRTLTDLANDTTVRLAQVPGIVGIKDATGDLYRTADLVRRLPSGFCIVSGDDATAMSAMLAGAHGVISVTTNVAPRAMRTLCDAARAGHASEARACNDRLLGLHRHLFVEANPIPVKWALEQMGLIEAGIRLPLTPLSAGSHDIVRSAMQQAGIEPAARTGARS